MTFSNELHAEAKENSLGSTLRSNENICAYTSSILVPIVAINAGLSSL